MGRTLHEVFRIREVRDHRTGGTVVALNPSDTGSNRDPEIDVLRLVQPIPGGRDRSSGGWQADHGLITSPAFILMKAADRFANPTTTPNQLWQTDFTYLKVIGWGWFYLSTVL